MNLKEASEKNKTAYQICQSYSLVDQYGKPTPEALAAVTEAMSAEKEGEKWVAVEVFEELLMKYSPNNKICQNAWRKKAGVPPIKKGDKE
jgi:hypothetical protein